ncbi:MAG: ABC transporter ATP-binding protein [Clostridia bacterium]|nr:ABC transporter ATP-binding protein [Clostridia bacterium]
MIFGKHINRYYLRYAWVLLLGIVSLVAVDYFQLEIPEFYNYVVNGLTNGVVVVDGQSIPFDMDFLLDSICRPMLLIIAAMVTGRFLWRICFFGAGVKLETDLRNRMFDHSKDLSHEYYQVNKVGNLMSLYTNDLDTVQECFGWGVMMFCDALLLGALAIYKMWKMNRMMTMLSCLPLLCLLAVSAVIGHSLMKKWDKRQEAYSDLSDFSQESFSGIAVIKAYVKEAKELMAFRRLNEKNEVVNIDYTRTSVLLRIFVTLFVESVICVILGYGGYLVYNGIFDAGKLVEFIGYFTSVVWPVMAVSELIDMTSRGRASLRRIGELLDAPIDVCDREDVTSLEKIRGDIEFRNLTFTFSDGEHPALENVSFRIEAGESVGIVGKTGSGKTTIVDLILRIYNIPDGMLFIDGHDVNSLSIRNIRENAAYVPQDNFLFSDTIKNNIGFYTDEIVDEDVRDAARLADVDGNISQFPEGYDTVLGERGVTVSGGQKQRISIARALMKDAPILILDDSVSAVDTKTEQTILQNLKSERKGKTTILIAHRVTTVAGLDKIIYIDEGRVSAVGTHELLCESCPDYRRMVELQRLEDEGGAADA